MKITADTITDAQIRELRRTQSPVTGNCAWLCMIALGEDDESTAPERADARARCAEILNARAKETSP